MAKIKFFSKFSKDAMYLFDNTRHEKWQTPTKLKLQAESTLLCVWTGNNITFACLHKMITRFCSLDLLTIEKK